MAKNRPSSTSKRPQSPVPDPNATQFSASPSQSSFLFPWPSAFAPPRRAAFMAAALLALAAMVFGTAALGGFTAVKISMAQRLDLTMPELVSPANFDLAFVICGMGAVILTGLVHPVLGLSLLLLARAWLDGYTFPGDNIYFTWSIYLLLALWLMQPLRRRAPIRAPLPALLFGGFILALLATTRHTWQYYATYQLLWLWIGYGALFLLAINALRDRAAFNIILTVFMIAMGLQAAFSILHFEYLLPHLREVIRDPAVLRRFFNTDVITPELARRFMVNRAFGTMLFPNALAAYLLLGIPFACLMALPYWRDLMEVLKRRPGKGAQPTEVRERVFILAMAVIAGVLTFIAVFAITHFPKEYRYANLPLPVYFEAAPLAVIALLMAVAAGLGCCLALLRLGVIGWWLLLRFIGIAILAPLLVYSFWITYSRGAYLALVAASLWGGILFFVTERHWQALRDSITLKKTVAALLILATVASLVALSATSFLTPQAAHAQGAQRPPQVDPRTQVSQEGLTLTMTDLADPASFRLRLGYWHVALRMALGNLLTGVGLGNFAIAYPVYQYIGAGDVREAHNGFLQMFSETGLAGGMLFGAFWIYFGLWGAGRIVRQQDRREKLILLGLYTGIVAFCCHAFLDINFSHPSLMLFAMVFAGLFYARVDMGPAAQTRDEETESRATATTSTGHALGALVLLFLLLVFSFAAGRVYAQQLAQNRFGFINVSNEDELNRRMRAGRFFLIDLSEAGYKLMTEGSLEQYPRIPVSLVRLFFDDFSEIEELCSFYRRSPDVARRFLLIEAGEPIPPDGLMVVRRPFLMRRRALERIADWLVEMKTIDARFPFSPELAMHIATWHEMHANHMHGFEDNIHLPGWVAEYLHWAEILTRRNPNHADVRMYHARALLWPVIMDVLPDLHQDADTYIERSLEQWEHMLALAPISPGHRHYFAYGLEQVANYCDAQGRGEEAAAHRARAQALRQEAAELQQRRNEAQLYP